jgi:hypothetical protein
VSGIAENVGDALITSETDDRDAPAADGDFAFSASKKRSALWPWRLLIVAKWLNRFLKLVHAATSILFIAGGIQLAMSYNFENP